MMKHLHSRLCAVALLLAGLCTLSGCMDDDEQLGARITGHWFGYLGMYYNGEPAEVSEIEFNNNGWYFDEGTGIQVDYYRYHAVTNYFDWVVRDGIIYLTFVSDPSLDCTIEDYEFGRYSSYFRGVLYSRDGTWTEFRLRNYDNEWASSGYYYDYYVKPGEVPADSAHIDTRTAAPERYVGRQWRTF